MPADPTDGPAPSRTDRVVEAVTRMVLDGRLAPGDRLPVEKELATELGVSRGSLREGMRALAVLGVVEIRQGDGTYVTSLDPALLVGPLGLLVDLQGLAAPAHTTHVHAVRRLLETEVAGLAALAVAHAGVATPAADDGAVPTVSAVLTGPTVSTSPSLARDAVVRGLRDARAALAEGAAILATAPDDRDHAAFLAADRAFHRALGHVAGNPVLAALADALGGRTAPHRLRRGLHQPRADERTQTEHEAILAAVVAGDVDRARVRSAAHLLAVEDFLATAADTS